MKIKTTAFLLALFLAVSCLVTSCAPARQTQSGIRVTDMAGRQVTVPEDPKSICVLDPFAAPVVVMFGYGDRMPTTINAVSRNLLLLTICPALNNAVNVKNSGSVNAEAVLQKKTDFIIVGTDIYGNADEKAKLDTLGIPYIVVSYNSMQQQMDAVTLLGKALQSEPLAEKYVRYYQQCMDEVKKGVADLPQSDVIKLYHSVEEAVRTDYDGSLCADWISLTRVTNVALNTGLSYQGDKAYATLEQIYAWDPDVIICNETGVANYVKTDSKWAGLRAVISGDVYQMPIGISRWGHTTSIETPLAMLWLAKLLYPQRFSVDIRAEMKNFYQNFFKYTVSDSDADNIMSGVNIRTGKSPAANN